MTDRPNSYDYEALLACGRGELFGPGNAQLPAPPMLMVDRVTSITADGGPDGKGQVVAEFDVNPDLWFFKCHFIGDPVMPGCLGLDALWQLTGFYLGWRGMPGRGRALGVGDVKFARPPPRPPPPPQRQRAPTHTRPPAPVIKDSDGQPIYTTTDMRVGLFS